MLLCIRKYHPTEVKGYKMRLNYSSCTFFHLIFGLPYLRTNILKKQITKTNVVIYAHQYILMSSNIVVNPLLQRLCVKLV